MLLRDKASMTTSRKTLPNGFLQVDAVLSRTGIQEYFAGELGLKDRAATDVVRVWRPEAEVFSPASIASFASVALTDDHPAEDVTPDNVERLGKGWVGQPYRDGDFLKAPITFSSKAIIDKLMGGKDELSNGYDVELEWSSGVVPQGERDAGKTYDAIQRNIIGNHVALVDAGRCGGDCRVLDSQAQAKAKDCASKPSCSCQGDEAMADTALTKKMIDGVGLVESTAEGFAVIDSLTQKLADAASALETEQGKAAAAATAHEEAIRAKDQEIEDLKAKALDQAAIDARVAERAKLIVDAQKVAGKELTVDGLSDLDVKKAAVTARQGEDKVKDKPDAYFLGAFEFLADQAVDTDKGGEIETGTTGLGDALKPTNANDAKPTSYEERMAARWKTSKKGA